LRIVLFMNEVNKSIDFVISNKYRRKYEFDAVCITFSSSSFLLLSGLVISVVPVAKIIQNH
jgi:hypothetical protein